MEKMKELYEKVAGDDVLKAKFNQIMEATRDADKDSTLEKLVTFAKEQGYEVGAEEIASFFKELIEGAKQGQLSESELDSVAGGKSLDPFQPQQPQQPYDPGYPGRPITSMYNAVISVCRNEYFW